LAFGLAPSKRDFTAPASVSSAICDAGWVPTRCPRRHDAWTSWIGF